MSQDEKELPHLKLSIPHPGYTSGGQLKLNGQEIGQWVNSIGISYNATDRKPRVWIVLDIPGGIDVDIDDANVKVSGQSRKMLEALGWTPPSKDST